MVVGYLHRSMEKLAEERTYTQNIPFTDRMDYLAAMTGNLGYCLAVEKLAGIEVPERAQYLRVDLRRAAAHRQPLHGERHLRQRLRRLADAAHVHVPRAREDPRPVRDDLRRAPDDELHAHRRRRVRRAGRVLPGARPAGQRDLPDRIDEYEELLLDNEILLMRARDVGVLTPEVAINASLSGPMLRGAGIAWDIRKADPYCVYDRFDFDIPVGHNGDCYDRIVVRIEEMRQSVRIIQQALHELPGGPAQGRCAAGAAPARRRGLRAHRVAEG